MGMERVRLGALRVALVGCALAVGAAGPAELTHTGGIVDGRHMEPRPGQVLPLEKRDGVAASAGTQRENARTVDQLDRQLLGAEAAHPPGAEAPPAPLPPRH